MKRLLAMIGEGSNGVEYVRFRQPFRHLRSMGFESVTLGARLELETGPDGYRPRPKLFDGIDGVIFPQTVLSPELPDGSRLDLAGQVLESAARRGIPTIYSVDDFLPGMTPDNPAFERIGGSIDSVRTIVNQVDAAFVTTPTLAGAFPPGGPSVHVLPNAIDTELFKARPRRSRETRVGWAGSSSHLADLLMVLPAIRELQRRVDSRFILFGLVQRPIEEEAVEVRKLLPSLDATPRERAVLFLDLVERLAEIDYIHVPFVEVDAYFEVLPALDLDVGICPLLDTEFNRHKSALKFYEYAMSGSVTVASAVPPYVDEVSICVPDDVADWSDALEALLRFPADADRELASQRDYVLEERTIQTLKHRWADALNAVLAAGVPAVKESR